MRIHALLEYACVHVCEMYLQLVVRYLEHNNTNPEWRHKKPGQGYKTVTLTLEFLESSKRSSDLTGMSVRARKVNKNATRPCPAVRTVN